MSAIIRRLTPAGPIIDPDPDVEIVAKLEELLKMAKANEIKAFAWVLVDGGDGVNENWIPGCAQGSKLVAGAASLSFRVTRSYADN